MRAELEDGADGILSMPLLWPVWLGRPASQVLLVARLCSGDLVTVCSPVSADFAMVWGGEVPLLVIRIVDVAELVPPVKVVDLETSNEFNVDLLKLAKVDEMSPVRMRVEPWY